MLATQPRPQLASHPSSPGLDIPGGYPRNSVVYADNKWDRAGGVFSYLPAGVASYFHYPPGLGYDSEEVHVTTSKDSDSDASVQGDAESETASEEKTGMVDDSNNGTDSDPAQPSTDLGVDAPVPTAEEPAAVFANTAPIEDSWGDSEACRPLPPTIVDASPALDKDPNFESVLTPVQELEENGLPATPSGPAVPSFAQRQAEPVPAIAPLASGLSAVAHASHSAPRSDEPELPNSSPDSSSTSTSRCGSGDEANSTSTSAQSTATTASSESASEKLGRSPSRLLGRLATLRRGHRKTASASESASPSPSPARHPALSMSSSDPFAKDASGSIDELREVPVGKHGQQPRRTHSILRAVRGEAKVIAGKLKVKREG
ncbi:hypothetical protein HMN09_00917600 [Mycena chlorophos]|uniref:Uncharacterized protein n=1 Tax=Mycena chlorophos TaxID=658473 RepID=A0A8H6SIN7_MYCCL|nr:hypothetical protein HMN09_00917600 [Mycena chlorophos]